MIKKILTATFGITLLLAGLAVDALAQADAYAATPSDEAGNRIKSIRRNEYFYQSYGRVDPFRALVTGEFEAAPSADLVDMNAAVLVGVMWGANDKFALLEDGYGNGFILHVGDPVRNGRVIAVNDDSVVASISLYGITSRVVLRLEQKKGLR
jgi:hypothetical protein